MDKTLLSILCISLMLCASQTAGAKKKINQPPLTSTVDPVAASIVLQKQKNLYRCDHLLDFKETTESTFHLCCQDHAPGTFVCPNYAPPGHVCGYEHPPGCCKCNPLEPPPSTLPPPTTTTTTTTTTEAPQEEGDTEEDDEDEEDE